MAEQDPAPEQLEIPLAWVGVEDVPILFVNQFLFQVAGEEITLGFGQVAPPALFGPPEQQEQQARELAVVPVKPVSGLALNRRRVEEMIALLQQTLENQDKQRALLEKEAAE